MPSYFDIATGTAVIDAGYVAPSTPVPTLNMLREAASLTRYEFCTACVTTGVLNAQDAIAAAKGEWPVPLAGFLAYLNETQSTDAQMEWASCVTIHRMHPFVLMLESWLGLTDTQLDVMFGIAV